MNEEEVTTIVKHIVTPASVASEIQPKQAQSRWRITIAAPPKRVEDVELQRRRHGEDDGVESPNVKRRRAQCTLLVDFCPSSSVSACGTQVWAAALLLSDYLVHIGPSLEGQCVLELGAGIGVPGMALAKTHCCKVFLTDYANAVLEKCCNNVEENDLDHNEDLGACAGTGDERNGGGCSVRRIDWTDTSLPPRDDARYGWTGEDLKELALCNLAVASDVAYAHGITESFISFAEWFLGQVPGRILVVALERRVCFTAPEMAPTSREYDFFFSRLDVRKDPCPQNSEGESEEAGCNDRCMDGGDVTNAGARLIAVRLPVNFEQRLPYERHEHLQLWQLRFDQSDSHPETAGRG